MRSCILWKGLPAQWQCNSSELNTMMSAFFDSMKETFAKVEAGLKRLHDPLQLTICLRCPKDHCLKNEYQLCLFCWLYSIRFYNYDILTVCMLVYFNVRSYVFPMEVDWQRSIVCIGLPIALPCCHHLPWNSLYYIARRWPISANYYMYILSLIMYTVGSLLYNLYSKNCSYIYLV